MSDETMIDPKDRANFAGWEPKFLRKVEGNGHVSLLRELESAGCDLRDLYWCLFWIAQSTDDCERMNQEVTEFFATLDGLIVNLTRVINLDRKLQNIPLRHARQIDILLDLHKFGAGDRGVILCSPIYLDKLLELLKALARGRPEAFSPKLPFPQDSEALLFAYVNEATKRRVAQEKLPPVIIDSCVAFGVKKGKFTDFSVLKRHSRYKQANASEYAMFKRIMGELVAHRKSGGTIPLLPFFFSQVERAKQPGWDKRMSSSIHTSETASPPSGGGSPS